MGTRSTIAVVHEDGSVSQCYCHWDGYLEHNGKILVENYNTRELAEQLISHGDISSLGPRIEPTGDHTFDEPEKGVTVYYGRDRGEPLDLIAPQHFVDMSDFNKNFQSEEYDYLFIDGEWVARDHGSYTGSVVGVSKLLENRKDNLLE